jgi:hypothetical protein
MCARSAVDFQDNFIPNQAIRFPENTYYYYLPIRVRIINLKNESLTIDTRIFFFDRILTCNIAAVTVIQFVYLC